MANICQRINLIELTNGSLLPPVARKVGLDALEQVEMTQLFARVAMRVYGINTRSVHLDSSGFAVPGQYGEKYSAVNISWGIQKANDPT